MNGTYITILIVSVTMPQEAEDILNHLRRAGAIRAGTPATRLGGGTVNTTWRVGIAPVGSAVLRVGPDRATVEAGPSWLRAGALACEAIVVDRVRDAVAVPATLSAGFRGRPWLMQELVPGRLLAEVLPGMDRCERQAIWRDVGVMLRRLHDHDGRWFGTPDGHQRFPDWPSMILADAEGLLTDARRYELDPSPFEHLREQVEAGEVALRQVERPAIVHSDLDPRHIFVQETDEGWEIVGVIDWEYARYVDPWSESLLVTMLARPGDDPDREALLEGYGPDPVTLADPAFQARQEIYRGIADGWALTDAARLKRLFRNQVNRR